MNKHPAYLLFTLLVICFAIYWPGLSGGFLFDDFPNIINNNKLISISNLSIESIHSAISQYEQGPIGRPVSFISFAINYALTGIDPFYFKLTNLLIHLLNGIILYLLLKGLLMCIEQDNTRINAKLLSLTVTSAWLLHPFQISSVLYVVQRMAELSTFFILIALLLYVTGRLKLIQGKKGSSRYFIAMFIPFFLALFSKENAVLFFAYLFVIEIFLLRFRSKSEINSQQLKKLYLLLTLIGLPIFIYMMFKYSYNAFGHRDFTLTERLLTESRVLWFYIQSILLPDITKMTIFHDDIVISQSLFEPVTTFFSILSLIILIIIALFIRKKEPVITFGIFLFFSAHILESTTMPLELIHEHRNYFASIGLLLALFYGLFKLAQYTHAKYINVFIMLFISFFAFSTLTRAEYWGNELLLAKYHALHHPQSLRSQLSAGASFSTYGNFANSTSYKTKALEYYKKAYNLAPDRSAALFSIISIHISLQQENKNQEYIEKLLYNLKYKQVYPNVLNAIWATSACLSEEKCYFPLKLYKKVIKVLLENTTIRNHQELAQLYSANSNLAWLDNNIDLAIQYNQKAVDYFPQDSSHALNHASLLMIKGEFNHAEKYFKMAESIDSSSFTAEKINTRRIFIERLKAKRTLPNSNN